MSSRRQVWDNLANLVRRVETAAPGDPANLEQEIRKLGKTQHKANLLAEEQNTQIKQALTLTQELQGQNTQLFESLVAQRVAIAQKDTLEAILPALDGIEHAISSGKRYLQIRDLAAEGENLTPKQTMLVSPADRAMLSGWLDGLNLVRERMLAILDVSGVTPITTLGQPFDPYQHIAVGTLAMLPADVKADANFVVGEERRGYRTAAGVIRFAEVIVYRPK